MNRFALKIAICNSIIYCIATGTPTIIDPLLEHYVVHGARIYPLGLWILIPSILVLGLTYVIVNSKMASIKKALITFFALAVPTWLTIPNFAPEIPHLLILLAPIWFGIWTALTTYVKFYDLRYDFITRTDMHRSIKIERLKMEHETWFRILLGFFAGYIVIEVAILLSLYNFATSLTSAANELVLLQEVFGVLVVANGLVFLLCFVWEMVCKIKDVREYTTSIR